MPKKKKPGQLPSGNYRTRVCIGKDENGVRKFKSFTAKTKAEADYLAREYMMKHGQSDSADMLLRDAYNAYISSKTAVLSPCTVKNYRSRARADFPDLMGKRLSELTEQNVQVSVNIMSANHSPKTIRNAHGLLSAVLGMFRPDIQLHTRLPQKIRPDLYVPSKDDIKAIMDAIRGTELEKAVLLAAFCSLRRSEVCALTADNIDFDNRIIYVSSALVPAETTGYTTKQPKSDAGYREIKAPRIVIDRLPREGKIVNLAPSTITNRFCSLTESICGVHFRFHDLRHYQASILHAMGVPDKYIMERGGWRTDSTLKNIYQHTMSDKRKQVEDEICAYFDAENP